MSRFFQKSQDDEKELQAENGRIFHCLQNLLTSANLASFSTLSHLHQVLICGIYVLLRFQQFWNGLQEELAQKGPYVDGIRLRLHKLQVEDNHACKFRAKQLVKDWQDIDGVLHYQGLPYVPEIIQTELISRYHDNPLAGHFGIKKTHELIARKYYWPTLCHDVEDYVKGYDVCLASKAVWHKPYGDLQSLPVPTHRWKDLLIDFVKDLLVLTDWKGDSYNSILVIVNRLTKMVHYKPVKVTIDAPDLAEVIINVVMRHYGFPDSIVTDWGSLFTSKFWSSLYYFLGIKRRLFTALHPQTDRQTERQNSTMEAYFRVFVNFEQNDWARLLPMAEFA